MLNKNINLKIIKNKIFIFVLLCIFTQLSLVNATLDKETYQKRLEQWKKLTPEQRQVILQNYKKYQKMPESEKKIVQENYQQWEKLPQPEREVIKQKVKRFKQLSPEKKVQLLEEKRPELKSRATPKTKERIKAEGSKPVPAKHFLPKKEKSIKKPGDAIDRKIENINLNNPRAVKAPKNQGIAPIIENNQQNEIHSPNQKKNKTQELQTEHPKIKKTHLENQNKKTKSFKEKLKKIKNNQ